MELLWKSGKVVPSSQRQRPPTSDPPLILPASGCRSGEGNASLPQPQPPLHHQNLFIQEDKVASWLHHPNRQDYLCSGVASTPTTHPQSSVSLAPPQPPNAPYGQIITATRAENYINFSMLRENIFTGCRVRAGQSMQVGSSAFPATESYLTPATLGTESGAKFIGRVSRTFAVPGRGRKDKAVASQTVCGTEPVQIKPAIETEIADDREETTAEIMGTEEARGSTSRKRSRVAEMHNLSERRRREKINEKMKTLQELIPRCTKNDKASMLDDVIDYVKTLQMQVQMMSMGYRPYGAMPPMMYEANTQQFIPHMDMGMNRPPQFVPFPGTSFPWEAHMAGISPRYPASLASDSPRVHLPSLQPGSTPASNQSQFPAYMNPYSQFVGQYQQQPPPPLQSQTTSQLSFCQASSSKEQEDQDNQPTG